MKKLTITILSFIFVVTALNNCKKVDLKVQDELLFTGQFYTLDGRLCFADLQTLESFYLELVEHAENRDTVEFPTEQDFLNYFSCVAGISSALNSINVSEIDSSMSREENQENWLLDEFRMALLNQYYEITVGENVYIYLSENQIYRVPYNDSRSLQILRNTTKGSDQINPVGLGSGVELISSSKLLSTGSTRGGGMECWYSPSAHPYLVDCEPNSVTRNLLLSETTMLNGIQGLPHLHPASWTVDWGDGDIENYSGIEVYANHVYASLGSYVSKVSYSYVNCFGSDDVVVNDPGLTTTIELEARDCSKANKSKIAWHVEGIRKIKAELWKKKDIFGNHQVAKTTSYRWESTLLNPQMHWNKQPCYVKAEINYEFANSSCNATESGLETDWGNFSSSQRAAKTNPNNDAMFIRDEVVHSYHEIEANPNNLVLELYLNACD